MTIAVYCQHVLGVGHLFRSLEICRALAPRPVVLITGGPPVEAALPENVREFRLPALVMDERFSELRPAAPGGDLEALRRERRRLLSSLFAAAAPEAFVVELYPFGRKAFGFELDPLLAGYGRRAGGPGFAVCSVRDVLVEKRAVRDYEERVVARLNRDFDAVLVHADPRVVRLEETFGRLADLVPPVLYTGFVTSRPPAGARDRLRCALRLGEDDRLVVASAGGGSVGFPLLAAVLEAVRCLEGSRRLFLQVFTGPFLPPEDFQRLQAAAGPRVRVERFSREFLSWLAAADLSISMGGYNTTMNLLAAGVPALVWPFPQNREQRLRCRRLEALGALAVLEDADLDPSRLARAMAAQLERPRPPPVEVDLNGAQATARWIAEHLGVPTPPAGA